ncbi:unnamed protein product [Closterium sp. NIES-53]
MGCLFNPIEGFLKKADGAVALLEGMRLLNEDDGVNGGVQECTADVDLTKWPLFDGCDADEDAYRGVSSDRCVGEVEVHHFRGLFVVKAFVVVEAGYFDNVDVIVVAESEGVLRGVRWW